MHADKHQHFYKLPLLFLMEVDRHVQSTQNRKLVIFLQCINPLISNFTKCSNTLKQFLSKLPTNCLSVFDHFVGLALKGLKKGLELLLCSIVLPNFQIF